jgi:hypothetical protein
MSRCTGVLSIVSFNLGGTYRVIIRPEQSKNLVLATPRIEADGKVCPRQFFLIFFGRQHNSPPPPTQGDGNGTHLG